jgi:uncharacterized protein (TIGR02231 family)
MRTLIHSITTLLVILIVHPIPLLSDSGGIIVTSRFDEVTVYRDRALLTRTARAQLVPGEHRLVFEPLPAGLVNQSVHVRGEGTARVTILGVETEQAFPGEPSQVRVRELEEQIKKLQLDVDDIQSELSSLETERELLKSIRVHTGEQMGRELAVQQPDTRRWESTIQYLRTKLEENLKVNLERQNVQEEVKRRIELLQRELQQITASQNRDAKRVTVRVRAEASGYLDLRLTYLTGGASWQPVYDARVSHRNDDVKLTYNAVIIQRTGEDWKDARIVLSTARPAAGARMPVLGPWFLRVSPPRPPVPAAEGVRKQAEDLAFTMDVMEAARVGAVADEQITSMVFRVPGTHSVPGDGSAHQVYIDEYTLTGPKEYIASPKLTSTAFLQVKTKNETDAVLLPGSMNIFLGTDFVGSSPIGYTARGEPVELFLGIDEGIRIRRTEVSRNVDEGGFISKRKKTDFSYKIEVENYKQYPVTISIVDNVPVSQHSDIEVRVTSIRPEPAERSEQGIVRWLLQLNPGEKKEITYDFFIRHPLDMDISGI